ncbi:alpha-humulene synthase-like protein [Carex littledalei]|uniref:Alpha-humulene synthase-like protein n=1 Tax=Carex littledalei TaxID=544730 RepID=A0A833VQ37_9POAL|nr:alpha-humulene synthase-like protein [Carex littledalei]
MNSEPQKTYPAVCNGEKQASFARRSANYEPTSWSADTFITHTVPFQKPKEWNEARIRKLKEQVREILGSTTDPVEMVNLIDTIEHLGIGYHFKREIHDALSHLHDANLISWDLHHVATRFRLLRQHGFCASSDVFLNFKDDQGNFDENISKDPKGLLSLYNAGYLATPGEEILADAISFARGHLSLMVDDLRSPLKKQVLRALKTPLHKMLTRVEARFYIEEYDEEENRNEILLELAKLDFNTLQSLHLEEMKILSLWWKNLNIGENLKYARERLLECYLIWALGQYFEAEYTRARKMNSKLYALATVVDDTFDVYGTYEECKLLNDAIQRQVINFTSVDLLPMYLRNLCHQFIKTINNFEDELEPSEKYRMTYIVKSVQTLIAGYMQEVEWRVGGYTPSFNERKTTALDGNITSFVVGFPFLGVPRELITKEVFQWLNAVPDVAVDSMRIMRYIDEFVGHERESKCEQGPTTFDCYKMEHKLTDEATTMKFQSFCEDAWKRINQACLLPADGPMTVLEIFVNWGRTMETFYLYINDGFSKSSNTKKIISQLLLEPFSL